MASSTTRSVATTLLRSQISRTAVAAAARQTSKRSFSSLISSRPARPAPLIQHTSYRRAAAVPSITQRRSLFIQTEPTPNPDVRSSTLPITLPHANIVSAGLKIHPRSPRPTDRRSLPRIHRRPHNHQLPTSALPLPSRRRQIRLLRAGLYHRKQGPRLPLELPQTRGIRIDHRVSEQRTTSRTRGDRAGAGYRPGGRGFGGGKHD